MQIMGLSILRDEYLFLFSTGSVQKGLVLFLLFCLRGMIHAALISLGFRGFCLGEIVRKNAESYE
jgi:hypothetical protein